MIETVNVLPVHRLLASDLIWRSVGSGRFPNDQSYWDCIDDISRWLAQGLIVGIETLPETSNTGRFKLFCRREK